jgi:uncharacterized protein
MRSILYVLAFIVVAFCSPAQALALNLRDAFEVLEDLKAQGQLGEKPNGYLDVVRDGGQAAEVAHLINQERRDQYRSLAQQSGLTQSDVERMAGQRNLNLATSGHFIQQDGQWQKKP